MSNRHTVIRAVLGRATPRIAPRNLLVPAARMRRAGAHGGSQKTERQLARRDLASALREVKAGP